MYKLPLGFKKIKWLSDELGDSATVSTQQLPSAEQRQLGAHLKPGHDCTAGPAVLLTEWTLRDAASGGQLVRSSCLQKAGLYP